MNQAWFYRCTFEYTYCGCWLLWLLQSFRIFVHPFSPPANEVWDQVMFLHLSVIHSVHSGRLPHCMLGYTLPRQTTPQADTTLGRHPQADTHLGRHPPGQTPPSDAMDTVSTSGRCASYWNAYLFNLWTASGERLFKWQSIVGQLMKRQWRSTSHRRSTSWLHVARLEIIKDRW